MPQNLKLNGRRHLEAVLALVTLAGTAASAGTPSAALLASAVAHTPAGAPAASESAGEPDRSSAAAAVTTDGSALAKAAAAVIKADGSLVAADAIKLKLSSSGGTVRLVGTVATLFDRQQVARDAEGVAGVTGIRPSIMVKPGISIEPEALKTQIQDAVQKAGVAGAGFSVNVNAEGEAHLGGEVTDEWAAVNAARRVRGVTAIVNYDANLPGRTPNQAEPALIAKPSTADNPQAQKQAQDLLAANKIDGLTVRIEGNIAVLTGRASNLSAALLAPELVTTVPGILGIRNEITIPARHVRLSTVPDDARLKANARLAVARSRKGTGTIHVHAADGRIYLSGRVSSAEAARAAIEAAASVPGVREVVSVVSYPTLAYGS